MTTFNAFMRARETLEREHIITRRMLWAWGACKPQREQFTKTFGPGARVPITEETTRQAADAGLDLWWLSKQLLTEPKTRADWEQQVSAAMAARDAADSADHALYERSTISWGELDQCWNANRDAYLRTVAVLIVRAYYAQEAAHEHTA